MKLTDQQFWALCNLNAGEPVPLHEADLSRPFVYCRDMGVISSPMGSHQAVMSLLLAFQHRLDCGIDVSEKLGLKYSDQTADRWLESTPGAAFRSSVGKRVVAARRDSLTAIEKRWLTGNGAMQIDYAFEGLAPDEGHFALRRRSLRDT